MGYPMFCLWECKRNITNKAEIDQLLEDYQKSLIIHQYQQKLIDQRLPKEPTDEEMRAFYDTLHRSVCADRKPYKGMLLVVAIQSSKVSKCEELGAVGQCKGTRSIEKYSIQNAISYDYFGNKWTPFSEILRKMPLQVEDPSAFVASHRFFRYRTVHYFKDRIL